MLLKLGLPSLLSRWGSAALSLASIALSVALFLSIEKMRLGAQQSFITTLTGTDLIVGARSSPLQLLLYSVFHLGSPTQNIRYETYQAIQQHPSVAWTIPLSLGDSYRGQRVVGTSQALFEHYRYGEQRRLTWQRGGAFAGLFEVSLGAQVARQFALSVGDQITISHGLQQGGERHEQAPFTVSGILNPTGTPLDRALLVDLAALEAIHRSIPAEKIPQLTTADFPPTQLTSFLLGGTSRIHTLRLQHDIQNWRGEPLTALIPALTLHQLWQGLGVGEQLLRAVSLCVLLVATITVVITLLSSLAQRRREMAILRSLGASAPLLMGLLILEAFLLVGGGTLLGALTSLGVFWGLGPWITQHWGLQLHNAPLGTTWWWLVAGMSALALVAGLLPGLKAYFNTLHDGLQLK